MSHSYSSSFEHIVWSTKNRRPLISPNLQTRLYDYMGGIAKREGAELIEGGGTTNHVHIILRTKPSHCLANLMRCIKANSSKFINKTFPETNFAWQEGYGNFSVSLSLLDRVKTYIQNQEAHHKKLSFEEEFLALLKKHKIEYDANYILK